MTQSHSEKKGLFEAAVCTNRRLAKQFWRMTLELTGAGAEAFAKALPGQFAEIDVCNLALPEPEEIHPELRDSSHRHILLRRPFSSADVLAESGKTRVDILYSALGPATLRMTTLAEGDHVSIIGPLGNGFWVPAGRKTALLVAGGMGAPPLQHMAKFLKSHYPNMQALAFAGAKTVSELPFEFEPGKLSAAPAFSLAEFTKHRIQCCVATDDGSAGFKGLVTDCLKSWLDKAKVTPAETVIYACGPEPMLASLAKFTLDKKIDCQVSIERRMACGFGVCQSCAVECRQEGSEETIYKLCCKEGPVFDSREVVWKL